jgi:crotonobetainyl-CoA:carnitine CoA-transferase CaiB-like acyl-CoA transferase
VAERPLEGWRLQPVPADPAATRAGELLRALGAGTTGSGPRLSVAAAPGSGALADWAASGAMALTGYPEGPPLVAPGCPATAARGAVLALQALAGPLGLEGHRLLGERAAVRGLRRNAPWSPGGSCRAVATADGWVAVSLARQEDLEAVPALVSSQVQDEPWAALEGWAAQHRAAEVAERAQLLGIPAAPVPADPAPVWPPWNIACAAGDPGPDRPLVVDLSSLWAGPLCGSLLGLAGADVVRLESTGRPDGGRQVGAFDDLLHAGQPSVALPFHEPGGRAQLQQLVARADVVITSARPRALRQLGLDAEDHLAGRGSGVWVAITAHPVRADGTAWVGFGDDAAMAAGLVCRDADGRPLPCGDAIADPLTGVHAALAALACVRAGGRHLVQLDLRDVAASTLRPLPAGAAGAAGQVQPPAARRAGGRAQALGADTAEVLAGRWPAVSAGTSAGSG